MADNTQHSVKAETRYIVLQFAPASGPTEPASGPTEDDCWVVVDFEVPARDAEQAIEKTAQATLKGGDEAKYVAVAMARWKPLDVAARAVTEINILEAKS